ncbi:MAG: phenylalanine--tRNA ligase subunit beta [Candidatus Magasanikbacteria bacterium CG10_big_fil_rev_8_21_14_0_10_43_6]|uniref:Phenylalanine--tRNA ligase beta subunit n=1 Tax=Candidatus Magasanikbacteria bacterium CG10_big_fil_rev_8_21_14_0_10_43_6 TaxID=1974650 RepID=A0A2M6W0A6_9BACT|nr:MAG: phenylalanine--tRNA ligase subunit beta [Candidatus Magasanikbacteria bacterium CG10_big_fil_rev_8_21_14_0_10_43_6]
MKISKQWLEDFVDLKKVSPALLMEKITMHTVEIEEIINQAEALDHIVVGEITALKDHPDAHSLRLCDVSVGKETLPVVCGGSNLREGMKVAMGMVGAKVRWHGEGELIELKKTNIRGEASLGMICAAEEIGLGNMFKKKDEKEILDMTELTEAQPGTPLAEAFGMDSVVLDVDNKSMTHRPDLWGHYGLARDTAAIFNLELTPYDPPEITPGNAEKMTVDVKEPALCPRYMGVIVDGVEIAPSPDWLKKKLASVGVNPINNIVDITNYVMLELGQPMHAFDASTIADNHIIVRHAKHGETIVTLGGDEYELTKDMLVIADTKRAVAIAGIKGGDDSGVKETSTKIIFEAANFDATSVRRASTSIGLRTDASSRFEKSLDPYTVGLAMRKAIALTLELCPNATVVSNIADVSHVSLHQGPIELDLEYMRSRMGVMVEVSYVVDVLARLGFGVEKKDEATLSVTVPTWRATKDVSIQEDLIEEVARMYGYNNIPVELPRASITPAAVDPLRALTKQVKELLAYEHGYTEVYNYSFTAPEWLEMLGLDPRKNIELDNPIAKDRPLLRRSLLPNMLLNLEANAHRYEAIRLFEVGRTYVTEKKGEYADTKEKDRLPLQDTWLGMVYAEKDIATPFFSASEAVRMLASRLGFEVALEQETPDMSMMHPGRYATIVVGDTPIGYIGELHPQTAEKIGIPYRTAMVHIHLNNLLEGMTEKNAYMPLAQYPSVDRDIAVVVDTDVVDADVRATIRGIDSQIESVTLFDVYAGEHIDEGKKSLAYHIVYRNTKKTLTAEEADALQGKVLAALQKTFGAEIRT